MSAQSLSTIARGGRRIPYASLLLALAAVIAIAIPGWAEALQYDRAAIGSGQLWRVATGHFVHDSLRHLFWDLLAFLVLAVPCELRNRRLFLGVLGASCLLITAGNWLLLEEMQLYRGLSGVDSALFGLLLALFARRALAGRGIKDALAPLSACAFLTALFAGKLVYEMVFSQAVFTPGDGTPVPLAHLAGFLCGLALACAAPAPGRCKAVRPGDAGEFAGLGSSRRMIQSMRPGSPESLRPLEGLPCAGSLFSSLSLACPPRGMPRSRPDRRSRQPAARISSPTSFWSRFPPRAPGRSSGTWRRSRRRES